MAHVQVIGLDIAKSVLQVHGLDADGAAIWHKGLMRARLAPFFAHKNARIARSMMMSGERYREPMAIG